MAQTFEKPFCPHCTKPAIVIHEILEIKTPIKIKKGLDFIYESAEISDRLEQPETKKDKEGNVTLSCKNGHTWTSKQLTEIGEVEW